MIITNYRDSEYKVKIKDRKIDIFDYEEVFNLIQIVIKKIVKNSPMKGIFKIDIYVNYDYGIIMDIKKIEELDDIDLKITFHIDSVFLGKIDYFYLRDLGIMTTDIYYKDKEYFTLYDDRLEYDEIIYGSRAIDIINKGIKLKI